MHIRFFSDYHILSVGSAGGFIQAGGYSMCVKVFDHATLMLNIYVELDSVQRTALL